MLFGGRRISAVAIGSQQPRNELQRCFAALSMTPFYFDFRHLILDSRLPYSRTGTPCDRRYSFRLRIV